MGTIDDKTKELERKQKNSSLRIIIIIVVSLLVFAGLFLNGSFNKKQARIEQKMATENAETALELLNVEDIVVDSLRRELQRVNVKLNKIEQATQRNETFATQIENLQIDFSKENVIPVYYYQREKDGNNILDVLENSTNPIYQTEIVKVYDDKGELPVNTLYVGTAVNKEYVRKLLEELKAAGIPLKEEEYVSGKGTQWKDRALEIGFERNPMTPNQNSKIQVRLYSYKPDNRAMTKKKIESKLGAKGYQVRVFPDWPKKPSFFSDRNTIFYYKKTNEKQADSIREIVEKVTGLQFSTMLGNGLGVADNEKEEVFIIHYNGAVR